VESESTQQQTRLTTNNNLESSLFHFERILPFDTLTLSAMATLDIPPPIPTSLPKSRKSLSALPPSSSLLQPPHPTLHRSESDDVNAARNINVIKQKMGRRAMSIGGNAMVAGIVTDPTVKGLSPRSFRRVAVSFYRPLSGLRVNETDRQDGPCPAETKEIYPETNQPTFTSSFTLGQPDLSTTNIPYFKSIAIAIANHPLQVQTHPITRQSPGRTHDRLRPAIEKTRRWF
jgi:hypothetical protein